jgi:hypothetical protein
VCNIEEKHTTNEKELEKEKYKKLMIVVALTA